jgi:hypothetical protein
MTLWLNLRVGWIEHLGGRIRREVGVCVSAVAHENQKRASNERADFPVALGDCRPFGSVQFVVSQPHRDALIHFLVYGHNSEIFLSCKKLNQKVMRESQSFTGFWLGSLFEKKACSKRLFNPGENPMEFLLTHISTNLHGI